MSKKILYLLLFKLRRPIKRAIQIFLIFFYILKYLLVIIIKTWQEFDIQWFTNAIQVVYYNFTITLLAFIKLGHYRAIVRYISTKAFNVIVIGVLISASIYLYKFNNIKYKYTKITTNNIFRCIIIFYRWN